MLRHRPLSLFRFGFGRQLSTFTRFRGPADASLTPGQRALKEEIEASRTTGLRGPFGPWLANPAVCRPAQELGRVCRYETDFPLRESELVILTVARAQKSPTEFEIHEGEARKAGLEEGIIESLRNGERPEFCPDTQEREAALHDFASQLLGPAKNVDDATYSRAQELFGDKGVVELTSIVGYYTFVAMTLNVFGIPPR